MAATWLDLPRDIWFLIFEFLEENLLDAVRFRATCSTFQSIASSDPKNMYCLSSPLLLLPRGANSLTNDFFSLANRKRAYEFHLPELQNMCCFGSSYGWLFTIDLNSGDCSLLNPINRVHISLPPVPPTCDANTSFIPSWPITKAIISADPSNCKSFVVMLIYNCSRVLSYCRLGDIYWTCLSNQGSNIDDAICHMGKFYVVHQNEKLVSWDHCDIESAVTTVIDPTKEELRILRRRGVATRYLVNSIDGTELLMVCELSSRTFLLFKFDKEENKFVELQRLGDDRALFLSPHCAFCVSSLGSAHILANYIYSSKYVYHPRSRTFKDYVVYEYNIDDEIYKRGPVKVIYPRTPGKKIYKRTCEWNAPCIWVIPSTEKNVHTITKTKNDNNNINKRKPAAVAKSGESKVRRGRKN